VPVRYSIRRQQKHGGAPLTDEDQLHLERQILQNDDDLEYKPSMMEGLFQMSHNVQELRKILLD
jgi:hypothetical protein